MTKQKYIFLRLKEYSQDYPNYTWDQNFFRFRNIAQKTEPERPGENLDLYHEFYEAVPMCLYIYDIEGYDDLSACVELSYKDKYISHIKEWDDDESDWDCTFGYNCSRVSKGFVETIVSLDNWLQEEYGEW